MSGPTGIENIHILNQHFYVDKGGYRFRVMATIDTKALPNGGKTLVYTQGLEISLNHMDWADSRMILGRMDSVRLKEIGNLFLEAAKKLEEITVANNAKEFVQGERL